MKFIVHAAAISSLIIFFANYGYARQEDIEPFVMTVDSTKGAKINFYCYESSIDEVREKPVLLVHGFNSNGSIWRDEKNHYIKELTTDGYDVIVVDMRGNPVDTDGDHRPDRPVVGNSWAYGVSDLGDDVGVALEKGIAYLNNNLPNRRYEKADVVTHSTGGLAVTSYSRSIGLVTYRNNIDTIIELAPPNKGSTALVANIKTILGIIPSVFTQSVTAYQYALEFSDNKVWIPGRRMESENLRKELIPESFFLKSIHSLGPDTRIKTFIAIGDEDWVVGSWSPVIEERSDIGYEYFLGVDHFDFSSSELVIKAILDTLGNKTSSKFFNRYKPYKSQHFVAFLSGPGIDHPDDTFDVITFAQGIDVSPRDLFNMHLRISCRKSKPHLLKYWEGILLFETAQREIDQGSNQDDIINEWGSILAEKNNIFEEAYIPASKEYLECPDIAVLANGYYNEMAKLIIENAREPVRLVDQTFDPLILNEQKVMAIPSGGLSGLSHSAIFKNKLKDYVTSGGTLICFSQQYGSDFNALPGPDIEAYGWLEDISCHSRAAYIEDFHQILSAQQDLYPDVKLDGYFTHFPDNAKVILRRTKNLMPAMLLYNLGNGTVIISSLYSDWGYVNGQTNASEINLIRDIFRWAKMSRDLPQYKINEEFQENIYVPRAFDKIELVLKSPGNQVIDTNISEGEPLFKLNKALEEPGIYSVDYILYDKDLKIIQPQTEGFYFSFSKPAQGILNLPEFSFDITSDTENYINGSEAKFTFHIRNNSSYDEVVKCKVKLQREGIEFTESVESPHNSAVSFDKKINVNKTEIITAEFYSSGNSFLGRAERYIYIFEPNVVMDMNIDKRQYSPGDTVHMDLNYRNMTEAAFGIVIVISAADADNNAIYYKTLSDTMAGTEKKSYSGEFTIPMEAAKGVARIKISGYVNSILAGSRTVPFEIPSPLIYIENIMPETLISGRQNEIGFDLLNPLDIDSGSGELAIQLISPKKQVLWHGEQGFEALMPHMAERFNFIIPLPDLTDTGEYMLSYNLKYGGGGKQGFTALYFNLDINLELAKTSFRSGEELEGNIVISNYSRFEIDKTIITRVHGFSHTASEKVIIPSNGKIKIPVSIKIPEIISAGIYSLDAELQGMPGLRKEWKFIISESDLRMGSSAAGFYLENTGGVTTDYNLKMLLRSQHQDILDERIYEGDIEPGQKKDIDYFVPEGLMSGEYFLKAECLDKNTLKKVSMERLVNVNGISADIVIDVQKNHYLKDEAIPLNLKIINNGGKIGRAVLNLRIFPSIQTGDLEGMIRDADGAPIAGSLINSIWTNKDGRYNLQGIQKGQYLLTISGHGFDTMQKHIEILPGRNDLDLSLNTTKYGNISCLIKDSIGSDITLAPIETSGSNVSTRYSVTSTEGIFQFKHVAVGTYLLRIEPEDITRTISVSEGSNELEPIIAGKSAFLDKDTASTNTGNTKKNDTDEIEPNNNFEEANIIAPDAVVSGTIYADGDEDFFKLYVDSACVMNMSLENSVKGLRPHMIVYDRDKRWMDSTAGSSGEKIKLSVEAAHEGYYYVQFKDMYGNFSSEEKYYLNISIQRGLDQYEPNNDFNTAKNIDLKKGVNATIFPKADEDYFMFTLKESGLIYIKMTGVPKGLRPSIKVYDASGRELSQKGGSSGEKIDLELEAKSPGDYYFMARDWYSNFSSNEDYSFNIYFIGTLDEYEPNNTKQDAALLEFGRDYFATISTKADSDFYKLSIPDAGKVILRITDVPFNIRPCIKLYREKDSYWIDLNASEAGEDLQMEFETANPSNYYIELQDRYDSQSSFLRYRLSCIYIPYNEYPSRQLDFYKHKIEIPSIDKEEIVNIEIPAIGIKGKYYLEAVLSKLDAQEISKAVKDLYVTEGDVLLDMHLDKKIYRPDETIIVKNIITNFSEEYIKDIGFKLLVDDKEYLSETFDLASASQKIIEKSIVHNKPFKLTAKALDTEIQEIVEVKTALLEEEVIWPDIAGRDGFEIRAGLKNTGEVDGVCRINLFKDNIKIAEKNIVIGPAQSVFNVFNEHITKDTEYKIAFKGDIEKDFIKNIKFGEKIEVEIEKSDFYPEGMINLPIKFINKGALDSKFDFIYRIDDNNEVSKNYLVLKGSAYEDSLNFYLGEGAHYLNYTSDFFSGNIKIEVKKREDMKVRIDVGEATRGALPAKVGLENMGCESFDAELHIEAEFFKASERVIVNAGEKYIKTFNMDISDLASGSYDLKVWLEKENRIIKSLKAAINIKPADIKVEYLEGENLLFKAGDNAKFRFNVANDGDVKDRCEINLRFYDIFNSAWSELIEPGKEVNRKFEFKIPEDMEDGEYEIEYTFKDEKYIKRFKISGAKIKIYAGLEGNIFKLNIKNEGDLKNIKLFAEVRCGTYEEKQGFILDDGKELEFNIQDAVKNKIYYGIYFESGKALYLDSFLKDGDESHKPKVIINVLEAGCDKDSYNDGEIVFLNWKIESQNEYSVDFSMDLIYPDSRIEGLIKEKIDLEKGINVLNRKIKPSLDAAGIYRVLYKFESEGLLIGYSSIFFDVLEDIKPKPNHPPILFTIGEKRVFSGDILEFFIEAIDVDNDILSYFSEGLPPGASFNNRARRFYWKSGYKDLGEHFVNFIVSDGKDSASEKVKITVSSNVILPPQARYSAKPVEGIAPLEVAFSAEALSNYKPIVKYEWDFDGQGIYDFSSLKSGGASFVYVGEGIFPARLRITDIDGSVNIYIVKINVKKNPNSPDVFLDVSPLKGAAPCKIFFKGDAVCPIAISKHEWDFEGDAVFDAVSSESGHVVKTYTLPGIYNAEYRVTSSEGISASERALIEIQNPNKLTVKSVVSSSKASVPMEINFSADISNKNAIQKYQWDFEGDGVFDYTSSLSSGVKYIYYEPGVYIATLRVTDEKNISAEDKKEVSCVLNDIKKVKNREIALNKKKGNAPFTVNFCFNYELGQDGFDYFWDFDSDGVCDLVTKLPEAEFTYYNPGVYMAGVEVKDKYGLIASSQETVYVVNGMKNQYPENTKNVFKNKAARIGLADGSFMVFPAGILGSDDTVSIKKISRDALNSDIASGENGSIISVGEYREYKLEKNQEPFAKEAVISIPYNDKDDNGLIDESNIDELTLDAYWYDDAKDDWKILSDALIFPKENIVTIKTHHFSIFGIAGIVEKIEQITNFPSTDIPGEKNNTNPLSQGSGSVNCFIATAVFNTTMAEEVQLLCQFRDRYLLKTIPGQRLAAFYYSFSPKAAEFIRHKPVLKTLIRCILRFIVAFLRLIL